MEEQKIGEVEKYFGNLGVAIVKLNGSLQPGERVHFRGKSDFEQIVSSLEVNNQQVDEAKMGQEVGIQVQEPCEIGDVVFKVSG